MGLKGGASLLSYPPFLQNPTSRSGPPLPCMEKQRQPQAVDLIWDLGVEEGQQATNIVHAVDL